MKVEGKVVIITGGGSGIGAASARLFAKHGAQVIVSDINLANAEKIAEEINSEGGKAFAIKTNVAKYDEMETLINTVVTKYEKLDVIVNNAGIGPRQPAKTAFVFPGPFIRE